MILITIFVTLIIVFLNLNLPTIEPFKILNKAEFKKLRKSANICDKPFRTTFTKKKVYSRMRSIEEKIDELEYDIYRQDRKFKLYDKEFMAYRKNRKKVSQDVNNARNEAKTDMDDIIKNRMAQMKKGVLKTNKNIANKIEAEGEQHKLIVKKQHKKALNGFKMSGNNPESEAISKMITNSSSSSDEHDKSDLMESIKKMNMPSGFAF